MAILTLINTAAGAGMLSLSSSIVQLGYILGLLLFFAAACNLYMGLYCFRFLMFKYPDTKVYSDLVNEVLGHKFEIALNVIFVVYVFGSLVAYILVSNIKSGNFIFTDFQWLFQRRKLKESRWQYSLLFSLDCFLLF